MSASVFITGATGYLGSALSPKLMQRGHTLQALVRKGSRHPLSSGCTVISGDALDSKSYADQLKGADTFVHLVGVSRPAPWKAKQFQAIDLVSVRASLAAAQAANIRHFVYVSVAHPAPVMKAYIRVRAECEALIQASGLPATILRPWYVLGPGHWWPYALLPLYRLFERLPATRESSLRLGLITRAQITDALVWTVEHPPEKLRILEVSQIRDVSGLQLA
jgi:uncharacterized protein YbjT (DUF2867 family)